jgi:hypothetical protein
MDQSKAPQPLRSIGASKVLTPSAETLALQTTEHLRF